MAWVCVDKDGTEKISSNKPFNALFALKFLIEYKDEKYNMYSDKCIDVWADDYSSGYFSVPKFSGTILPSGSIHKLIGCSLTWEDEPFELKGYENNR